MISYKQQKVQQQWQQFQFNKDLKNITFTKSLLILKNSKTLFQEFMIKIKTQKQLLFWTI